MKFYTSTYFQKDCLGAIMCTLLRTFKHFYVLVSKLSMWFSNTSMCNIMNVSTYKYEHLYLNIFYMYSYLRYIYSYLSLSLDARDLFNVQCTLNWSYLNRLKISLNWLKLTLHLKPHQLGAIRWGKKCSSDNVMHNTAEQHYTNFQNTDEQPPQTTQTAKIQISNNHNTNCQNTDEQ